MVQYNSLVPQGSVLGPSLFILYVNDLLSTVEPPILLHTDDIKIQLGTTRVADACTLQVDLHVLISWSKKWPNMSTRTSGIQR